jgi:phosphatidylserine/phosphatidylglycerophosphate/cardiolipin synthase-like enzyme
MIQEAKKAIHLEMYEFQQISIADELIAKKKAGLEVQVLLDQSSHDMGNYLSRKGVEVRYYPPNASKINHVKLLSVDGNLSLIGGMNWGNHSPMNHDADILIKGPAANDINTIFEKDWLYSGGKSSYTTPIPLTTFGTHTISNLTTFRKTADIKKHVLHMIKNAKQHLYLELYILTDVDVIRALTNAHHRGIDVRVLFDPNQSPNEAAYSQLRKAGVSVLYYPVNADQRFHIKVAVADHNRTIVGSCNWSKSGFYKNHEMDSDILGSETASAFESMFTQDWLVAGGTW